jgi:ABC-type Na+ efflux pump permease subunit/membrane protease YdiL (CAAX protease family)
MPTYDVAKQPGRPDLGRLRRLAYKELIEILRDRRTIITLALMPLLVYPLLGIVVEKLLLPSFAEVERVAYLIGFENDEQAERLKELLYTGNQLLIQARESDRRTAGQIAPGGHDARRSTGNENLSERLSRSKNTKLDYNRIPASEMRQRVREGAIDLGVVVEESNEFEGSVHRLIYNTSREYSLGALQFVSERLRLANEHFARQALTTHQLPDRLPASYFQEGVQADAWQSGLLTFLPLMLVLMTITGAVYPAIDLTAGERERGTMEILVAAPVSRLVLLFGKFVAVLAVALLTAFANLLAMSVTVYTLGLDAIVFGAGGFNLRTLGLIFLLLVVLAGFFSATLLGLTSFARSFKEAQAYLIPLMLVAFAPGLLSLTPNLEMNAMLALVPLANVVLAGRDLLAGQADPLLVVITLVSTGLYGLLSLTFAARIFGADSIVTGEGGSWSDWLRRPDGTSEAPSISTSVFFVAALFPMFVVVMGLANSLIFRNEWTVEQSLWANAAITAMLFAGLPIALARWCRIRAAGAFFFRQPSALAWVAAAMLGIAVWTMVYEFEVLILSSERLDKFADLFKGIQPELDRIPLVVKLICLALVPAVCEEIAFRGFILSGFLKNMYWLLAVVATAICFGLFHVIVRDVLLVERMASSTVMGLLLGAVCVRTGSIFPGMLLHAIHNGILIAVSHYHRELANFGWGIAEQQHLPTHWLVAALVVVVIGLVLLSMIRGSSRIS